MGTAPIKDVISLFPGNMTTDSVNKSANAPTGDAFAKAMNEAAVKTAGNVSGTNDAEAVKGAPEAAKRLQKSDTSGLRRIDDSNENGRTKENRDDNIGKDAEIVGKAIEEKTDEIKEAIKEELGITDEEFELAMAELGLVPADLFNPDSIKNLMLELSGEQDALSLITNGELLAGINNVIDIAGSAFEELEQTYGISMEDLNEIAADMTVNGDENAAAVFSAESVIASDAEKAAMNSVDVSGVRDEDDETETTTEDKPLKVEIHRDNDREGMTMSREVSLERAETSRKVNDMMNERSQEEGMQNSMSGQNTQQVPVSFDSTVAEAAAQMPEPYADTENILRQVTDHIRIDIGTDSTSMEMQLHPATLGTVNLQIASNNGVITAHMLVQNESVKAALESQMVRLLQTFEEQGQKVAAIEVSVAGYDLDRSLNQDRSGDGSDRKDQGSGRIGRTSRRRLNLNELMEEDLEDLTEEEQLAAEMMTANGTSVDYMA